MIYWVMNIWLEDYWNIIFKIYNDWIIIFFILKYLKWYKLIYIKFIDREREREERGRRDGDYLLVLYRY